MRVHRRRGLDLATLQFYGYGAKGGPNGADAHRATLARGHRVIVILVPAIDPARGEEVDQWPLGVPRPNLRPQQVGQRPDLCWEHDPLEEFFARKGATC